VAKVFILPTKVWHLRQVGKQGHLKRT